MEFVVVGIFYVDRRIINKKARGNGRRDVNWIQQREVKVLKEYIVACRPVAK
jgi:hypothetical protein